MTKKEKPQALSPVDSLLERLEKLKSDGFPQDETLTFLADLAALATTKTLKLHELKKLGEALGQAAPDKI